MHLNIEALQNAMGFGYYVLVYGVGVVAMVLSVMAFQLKRRVSIILSNFCAQLCWVTYFVLQGDLTSATACALSAVMLAVFSRSEKWKWALHPVTVAFFLVLLCGFSLLSFTGWKDIFPVLAGALAVIANSRKNENHLRIFSFFWCICWMCNSISKVYPVALANDTMCAVSTLVGLIRYRKKTQ